jgi:hypothetical protein
MLALIDLTVPLLWAVQTGAAVVAVDSAAVLDAAREAQAEFERLRVDHLPRTLGGGGGACDEIVGRFCFWHGDEDDDWTPPAEHPRVRAGRDRLIARLDSLRALSAGEEWIAGQLARYLVEAGRLDQAARAAAEFSGSDWWRLALQGYVHHAARRFAEADSSFAEALAWAPEEERCAWNDLSLLLDDPPAAYRRLSCPDRTDLEQRIWWLGDPLYLTAGNELRTEHFSRRVLNRLQQRARSGYAVRWGDDLEELLLRYGWPVGWERDVSSRGVNGGTLVVSHNAPRSRSFLPPGRFIEDLSAMTLPGWDIAPELPRSTYAPAYAWSLETMEDPQVGVFRRGDSSIVVAAFALRDEEKRGRASRDQERPMEADAALVFVPDHHARPIMHRADGTSPFRLALTVPDRAGILSLEAVGRGDSAAAARARWWLAGRGQDGLQISQPLLFDAPSRDTLPATLEEVFPLVRPAVRARPGERIGMYWETAGWGDTAVEAQFQLTVARIGEGWLRRAARTLRLVGRDRPSVRLTWSDLLNQRGSRAARTLAIELPEAAPGAYLLSLEVRVGDDTASAERELLLMAGPRIR